jgi:integrase/recombinase XerD
LKTNDSPNHRQVGGTLVCSGCPNPFNENTLNVHKLFGEAEMPAAKSLTPVEIDKVLQHIATTQFPQRNRVMFLMTVMAGLRVSEVAGLKISDVRSADGTVKSEIYLAAERVKHEHARTVYVSSRLQQELADYIASRKWYDEQQPLFFTLKSPRRGFTANTMAQHFFWMYKKAAIAGASSHSGRKTFLTSLASQGISVFVLASLAGHKSIATTQKYVTVNDDMKRKAVELV